MKNNKKLLILTTAALILASCGGGSSSIGSVSSNPIDSGTSDVIESHSSLDSSSEDVSSSKSSESTSRRPIGGSSSSSSKSSSESKPSSSSATPSSSSSIESSDSSEAPVLYAITLHGAKDNDGLTVSAPKSAYAGSKITLTVNLKEGYILEYIRLYAATNAEGGVRVNPNTDGDYEFTMPEQNLDIYYKGVKGYKVTFASDHATAKLASDSAEYDMWGENYPVYVCKASVESGYYFAGFIVKDESGNEIPTWDDAVDQIGFYMPKGNVTVTAVGKAIDTSLSSIAGTYTGGTQIDMNSLGDSDYQLVIGLDKKVTFTTDWTNSDFVGTYTYENNELNADVTNLSQDGYYTDTVRHLKIKFLNSGKLLAVEFSSETSTYRYLFGKTSEGLMAKKLYMSQLSNGDYTKAHRIVGFTSNSGDFFTYVNPTRTEAEYHLKAYEKGTTNEAYSLFKGKTYTLKKDDGTAYIEVTYDGSYITVKEPEADNPGGDPGEVLTAPFENKTYASTSVKIYNEDTGFNVEYKFEIKFGSYGKIDKVALTSLEWDAPAGNPSKTNLTYTYDADTGAISVNGLNTNGAAQIISYQGNGTMLYKGRLWGTSGYYGSGIENVTLKEVA